ncbi:imidazole glycerol phosphate synthase subunit HisF [Azospirillum lipoferum]|uniref:Imidazole glycerol phosphate synthase subunit HisF n=1 Tax=Azospirillum lipoferum (strain 4B) TaxID=862719 RepID=G7ZJ25_AZOL4|nr:imidazole glycerol phosphate synthase cyclase subunit [Azospirillum lipoferum]CBS91558.1 Imidazole glycerol phosphate synthase, HisF subunit [Azospirillum lipoferum 4B]
MAGIRIIARLDIKGENLIKGIHLEGLRVVGSPHDFALDYYRQGIDEIIYMDAVASLYRRNSLHHVVEQTAKDIFIPLTVGGGVRSIADAEALLRRGADKVAINTAALERPALITEIAQRFGSQSMVAQIDAKRIGQGRWECYSDGGREHSGRDVLDWARQLVDLGAGEILLTSIDREGTRKGFETDLIRAVASTVPIPVIASGGMGKAQDIVTAVEGGWADAVAAAHVLHYRVCSVDDMRAAARKAGIDVRPMTETAA